MAEREGRATVERAGSQEDAAAESARKRELVNGMVAMSASDRDRAEITNALSRFPVEMLEVASAGGTQIRPLDGSERYREVSPALRRLGVDVDAWPVPPAGLFVVEEKTMYLRSMSVMTIGHEFGHAVDAAIGGGVYSSGFDAEFRQAFAQARSFVTPYAATGLDEAYAENLRAWVGELNDAGSPWPAATPERLKAVDPRMSAYFDSVLEELRARVQERESASVSKPAVAVEQETLSAKGKAERRDYRQDITDRIVAAIENGTAPWQKGWAAGERLLPYNPTTEKSYRGGNTLRLMMEGHGDPRWMTYKQAQENGWQVRKGERGTQIEYWKFERPDGKRERDGKAGPEDPATESEGQKKSDEERSARPRVFYATVFNAEQIDGVPQLEKSEQRWSPSERAEQLLDALAVDVKYGGDRAFYSPQAAPNVIHVPNREQFHSETAFYDTIFHEAAHWTGHSDRLNRDLTGRFGSESYAKEELRAEIAGAFVAAELGIPRDADNNAAYVTSWISVLKNDKNEIFRAATAAQQIADFVFERALERVQDVGDVAPSEAPPSTASDISKLMVYEPKAWDIVSLREDSAEPSQTMTVLGRTGDETRIFGREGGGVLSVAAATFEATPVEGDVVRVARADGEDRVERVEETLSLGVAG